MSAASVAMRKLHAALERQQQMQQLMTPPVLDMAHHVATLAAQHAASAWQQMQQTSSAPWQQDPMACIRDMSFPLQTPATCDPRLMPPYFPGLPHQMGDPRLMPPYFPGLPH